MKALLIVAFFLIFLIPNQINAWWPSGPRNEDDCILKYQKEAKCAQATVLINFACKCRFRPEYDPLSLFEECKYNPDVYDCILDNVGSAQNDQAAAAIFRSCVSKYNK